MIEGAGENVMVITILADETMSVEDLGFEVETGIHLDEQPMAIRDHEVAAEENVELPAEEPPDDELRWQEEKLNKKHD